jgi:hypothetical protein
LFWSSLLLVYIIWLTIFMNNQLFLFYNIEYEMNIM